MKDSISPHIHRRCTTTVINSAVFGALLLARLSVVMLHRRLGDMKPYLDFPNHVSSRT